MQQGSAESLRDLAETADLINHYVAAWNEFGYANPPTPDSAPIPPLGERSADAIRAGHGAIKTIDDLISQLYALREQLGGELRLDSDIRAVRIDAMLAERKAERERRASAE